MPTSITSSGITFNDATSLTSGTLVANSVGTTQLAANSVTAAKLGTNEQKQLCKAWVNINGTTAGTWAGGTSTATRVSGSTTTTITTTNPHELITNNVVNVAAGGSVVAGPYRVTVTSPTIFTITTVASTALSAVSVTLTISLLRASYNVSSVTKTDTGVYYVNFAVAPDLYYSAVATIGNSTNPVTPNSLVAYFYSPNQYASSLCVIVTDNNSDVRSDAETLCVQVFSN